MRILFICGSLEAGRDGVGDHVRLLAGACAALGHSCGIIALHDPHVAESMESSHEVEQGGIPFLRLPSTLTWPKRIDEALKYRSRFQPDAISFHFVPYAFDPKGIVLKLNPFFRALTADYPLHIMFHELWIGAGTLSPFRQRLVGALQKRSLRQMISLLRPQWVTTSIPVYASMLKTIGAYATILPLFGHIPAIPIECAAALPARLVEAGITRDGSKRSDWWVALFFGSLQPEWKPEPLLSIVRRAARRSHKRVALVLVGRSGTVGDQIWDDLIRHYRSDFVFVNVGEQPVTVVSTLLHASDFGITTSTWHLLGKSSTVAAMLDHGLPIIVTRDDFQSSHCPKPSDRGDPLIHRCDDSLETKLRTGLHRRSPHPRLEEIASRFCGQLSKISSHHP